MANRPHIIHWVAFEYRRIIKLGLPRLLLKVASHAVSVLLWFLLLPITIALHLAGYRRVTVFTDRIGHLALEPDCLLKEQALGLIPRRKWFILAPPRRVANEHLLKYWESHFRIYRGRFSCFVLASMSRWGLMRQSVTHYIGGIGKAQAAYSINAQWGSKPPLLALSAEDETWGNTVLRELGIPEGAWFVCIHAREGGFSPVDEDIHAHRNGDIEALTPAVQEVIQRGGWVIRVGDPTMRSIPSISQLIDYAHHPLKSPRLDIILCAKSRFFLGNTSGISLVATIFGVPCALANMVPMSAMGIGPKDISIPKLHQSLNDNRHLSFEEVFALPISRAQYWRDFINNGVRVEENSPEDIRELVLEMFARLDGGPCCNPETKAWQKRFLNLLTETHYSFGTASNVSAGFLIRHQKLFSHIKASMPNKKLSIHHIGARGPTQAFPFNAAFDSSIINILYEADPDCISELKQLNNSRTAKVIILNECISGTGGLRTFCDAHHGYGSSLLEANPETKDLYIPAHWIDYDYTVYEAISAKTRRQVSTKTLDQITADYGEVPLPDFLSLDTQGSELEILKGSPTSLDTAVCIITEVEFIPLYDKQPLFGDICSFLTGHGFVFAKLYQFLNGCLYRAPLGLRGNGIPVTTDALFLRDPRTIAGSDRTAQEKALSLAKLAFFSVVQGYVEHGLWALHEGEHFGWQELDIAEPWFNFIHKFSNLARRFPQLMPETFAERHGAGAIGKAEYARRVAPDIETLNNGLLEMLELLRMHNLEETAESVLKQTGIDLKRLGLPQAAAVNGP